MAEAGNENVLTGLDPSSPATGPRKRTGLAGAAAQAKAESLNLRLVGYEIEAAAGPCVWGIKSARASRPFSKLLSSGVKNDEHSDAPP